ncbi:DNA-binding response OmpR family regulator [Rhizobium sp. BK650]|uniref:response regulator n=1 Tax=Rhizobium sp. BK650 TaxID=2586990 RepID=UPI00161B17B4|nr:response regulator [Rhizobium sp. BK650]MBB3660776.1 DNA-binding response OmpR family regulator [Rhizobium sp. BK650]
MRILIVEDEALIAMDLEDILVRLGHEIIGPARTRDEAVRLGDQAQIALVDVRLADGPTGPEIGTILSSTYGTTVVFTTGNPESVMDSKAGIGVVTKPYTPEAIVEALDYAIAQRTGRDAVQTRFMKRIPVAL